MRPRFVAGAPLAVLCLTLVSSVPAARAVGPALYGLGESTVLAVSCWSPGDCVAVGSYTDRHRHGQGFVVSQSHGTWGKARLIPGLAALNTGGSAGVKVVSCPAAGDCGAGGWYSTPGGRIEAYVVSERHGRWGTAVPVRGPAPWNPGGAAVVQALSCGAAGECTAAGYDSVDAITTQAFVVDEVHSTWRPALRLGGLASSYRDSQVESVSCAAPGTCSAGGYFYAGSGDRQAFVADEVNGTWRPAEKIFGLGALDVFKWAEVTAVSCPKPGRCTAVGFYASRTGHSEAFLVDRKSGYWNRVVAVHPAGGGRYTEAELGSVSCAAPGTCVAGGYFRDGHGFEPLLVIEANGGGDWGMAVPGSRALSGGVVLAVSCAAPFTCAAGGQAGQSALEAFVATEVRGRWTKSIEVPGTAALNRGLIAQMNAVSCAAPGYCSVGGLYSDRGIHNKAFVASLVRGHWVHAREVPGL